MSWLGRRGIWCCSALAALGACSPAHDWRDVRPAGTRITMQFPCRPVAQQRAVALAGPAVELTLLACTAGGQTWALAHAELADPSRIGPALAELRSAALSKLNAVDAPPLSPAVPGATPNAHAGRVRLNGRASAASDRRGALQMELALFADGTQVFQASVLGETLPAEAVDTFFMSIGVGRLSRGARVPDADRSTRPSPGPD